MVYHYSVPSLFFSTGTLFTRFYKFLKELCSLKLLTSRLNIDLSGSFDSSCVLEYMFSAESHFLRHSINENLFKKYGSKV